MTYELASTSWGQEELDAIARVVATGQFTMGDEVRRFERAFADRFGVESHGYHWYTTFSRHQERFLWVPPGYSPDAPLYVFGCPGKKSHGWVGAAGKYTGLIAPEVSE